MELTCQWGDVGELEGYIYIYITSVKLTCMKYLGVYIGFIVVSPFQSKGIQTVALNCTMW